ncbi:MAG: TusE/DsrC/DsvC family sulfur relay protein [Gammaproteobacteria bacterium]
MEATSALAGQLDDLGHLRPDKIWDKRIAGYLAALEGLELSDRHLEICNCFRQFYQQFSVDPTHRAIAGFLARNLDAEKASSSYLAVLFPQGFLRQACRIAGLPKPEHCL